jgi:gluconolactonase
VIITYRRRHEPTDGIRVDTKGNLFASAGDGSHVFSPDGVLLGRIHVPEAVTNCAFGGADRATLFIVTRLALYTISVSTKGVR